MPKDGYGNPHKKSRKTARKVVSPAKKGPEGYKGLLEEVTKERDLKGPKSAKRRQVMTADRHPM